MLLEWHLGLRCGSLYQYCGRVQVRVRVRVRVSAMDRVVVGMAFRVRMRFPLSVLWKGAG